MSASQVKSALDAGLAAWSKYDKDNVRGLARGIWGGDAHWGGGGCVWCFKGGGEVCGV